MSVFFALNFSEKLLKIAAIYYFNRSEYPMNASPINVAAPPKDAPTTAGSPPKDAPIAVYMLYNYSSVG